jgi:hypothetical protein
MRKSDLDSLRTVHSYISDLQEESLKLKVPYIVTEN